MKAIPAKAHIAAALAGSLQRVVEGRTWEDRTKDGEEDPQCIGCVGEIAGNGSSVRLRHRLDLEIPHRQMMRRGPQPLQLVEITIAAMMARIKPMQEFVMFDLSVL